MQLLSRLFLLLAVLLMPFGMASAPAGAPHHGTMADMPMNHCPEQAPEQSGKVGFTVCTMACSAALPATEIGEDGIVMTACAVAEAAADRQLTGLHPDTAVPPPKNS